MNNGNKNILEEEPIIFTQKRNEVSQIKLKQSNKLSNIVNILDRINVSNYFLTNHNDFQIVKNNQNNHSNNNILFSIVYRTKIINNTKLTLYPPITTLQHLYNDTFYFQSWHCFYVIDTNKRKIINASIILRNVDLLNEHSNYKNKGIILRNNIVVFQYGKKLLIFNLTDTRQITLLTFLKKYRKYYSFNKGKCLISNRMEIMKINDKCNPHIYYEYSNEDFFCNHKGEIITHGDYMKLDRLFIHDLEKRTVKLITEKEYFIRKKRNKGFYISKNLLVFKKFKCCIKRHQLREINSTRGIFCIQFKKRLYICDNNSILYTIPFDFELIHSIKERNDKLYIHSKRKLLIFDEKTKDLNIHYSETIQYEIFKYKGYFTYIVITPISIRLVDINTNTIIKKIDMSKYQPIKRVISFKEKFLIVLNVKKGLIVILEIEKEVEVKQYNLPFLFEVKNQREVYDFESPTLFYMITDSVLILRRALYRNDNRYTNQSFLLDLSSFNNKIVELNESVKAIKFLSYNTVALSINNQIQIFDFPFTFPSKAEFVFQANYIFDIFQLKDGRLIITSFSRGLSLVDYTTHKTVDLEILVSHIDKRISSFRVTSVYEYQDNVVLIRDIGSQTPIREEGHIYALDLNANRFLYTINQYGDNRYCFIFEPLKRMNVALSFDLAYLEIWNLESVQCNTKIFMFETQRVFELDNCQIVLMSKRGIRVVNAKY